MDRTRSQKGPKNMHSLCKRWRAARWSADTTVVDTARPASGHQCYLTSVGIRDLKRQRLLFTFSVFIPTTDSDVGEWLSASSLRIDDEVKWRSTCWFRPLLACLWCTVYYTSSEGVSTYLMAFPTVPPRINVRPCLTL